MIKLNSKNIGITILLALFIIGVIFYFSARSFMVSDEVGDTKEEMQEIVESEKMEEPAVIVSLFMDSFIDSASSNGDEDAVSEAVALFSEGGMSEIPMVSGQYHLGQLMMVQDYPDEGYAIEEITYQNPATGEARGRAEVTVRMDYSGGDVTKVFVLTKSEGGWQIDDVVAAQ